MSYYQKTIIKDDVELLVNYFFEKGMQGDYLQPDDAPDFEIIHVFHKGIDIKDFLKESVLQELEEKIIQE